MSLVEKVKEFLPKIGLLQSDLAKKLKVSQAMISQWMQGEYKGDVEKLEKKIIQFLELEDEKIQAAVPKIPFTFTSVAKNVFKAARYCHSDCEIGICYGASGLGKTTAIKEYASNNTGVIIIKAEPGITNKVLIQQLYEKLGLSGLTKTHEMKKAIVKSLTDSGWLIIVDEAEFLKVDGFTILRSIHDDSEYTFGLLFIGLYKLYNNLLRLKGDFAYLTNRIGYRFELQKLDDKDIKMLVSTVIKDNEAVLNEFIQGVNGNARILTKAMLRTLKLAQKKGLTVNTDIVASSIDMLMV